MKVDLYTIKIKMKLVLVLIGMIVLLSCKSSSGGHCDAYGKIETKNEKDNS